MENSISDRIDFLLLKINQNSGHLPSVSNSFDFSKNTFVFHKKRVLSSISTKLKVGKYLGKVVFKNIFFKLVSTSANHKKYRFLKHNFNYRNFKPKGKCFTVQVKKRERFRIVFTEDPLIFYSKFCFRIRTKIKRKLTGLSKNIETNSHKFLGRKTHQSFDPYIFDSSEKSVSSMSSFSFVQRFQLTDNEKFFKLYEMHTNSYYFALVGKKCARCPIWYDNIARYPQIFWIVRPIPFREFESNCNLQFKYLNNICGI
ncbi:hypothetical protein ACFFRR_008353 [Megaselia abdita]